MADGGKRTCRYCARRRWKTVMRRDRIIGWVCRNDASCLKAANAAVRQQRKEGAVGE